MLSCRCAPLLLALVVPFACSSSENQVGATEATADTAPSTGAGDGTAPATGSESTSADATTSDTGNPTSPTSPTSPTTPTTGETATTGEPAGSTSTGEGATCDFPGVYDCCCFSVEGDPGKGILSISCPDPGILCDVPQATCPEGQTDCDLAALKITSAEGLECALQALAAGTPGAISWGISSENGLNGGNHTLFVQEDGSVIVSGYEYKELDYTYTAVERRAKQDAAFFTGCVAKPDPERFECLRQAATGEPTETCLDGFSGNAGQD
ncbi:MAG TPA: hypothetical protein VGB85_33470 [Nannocystis sp.]|jgi:hypothetical protein